MQSVTEFSPEVSFVALHASVRIAWCVAHVELPTKARLGSRRWSPNYQLARSLRSKETSCPEHLTRLAHIDNADERTLSAHGIANDANVQFTPA